MGVGSSRVGALREVALREAQGALLDLDDSLDCLAGPVEDLVQLLRPTGALFRGALDFNPVTRVVGHKIEVRERENIFFVARIQDGTIRKEGDADGRDEPADETVGGLHELLSAEPATGFYDGNEAAGDGGGSGSAIGLKDIHIQNEGPFAKGLQVDCLPERAADQALDFHAAAIQVDAFAGLAIASCARKHGVFRGEPAGAGSGKEAGDAVLHGDRAKDARLTLSDKAGALCVFLDAELQGYRAKRAGGAAIRSQDGSPPRESRSQEGAPQAAETARTER